MMEKTRLLHFLVSFAISAMPVFGRHGEDRETARPPHDHGKKRQSVTPDDDTAEEDSIPHPVSYISCSSSGNSISSQTKNFPKQELIRAFVVRKSNDGWRVATNQDSGPKECVTLITDANKHPVGIYKAQGEADIGCGIEPIVSTVHGSLIPEKRETAPGMRFFGFPQIVDGNENGPLMWFPSPCVTQETARTAMFLTDTDGTTVLHGFRREGAEAKKISNAEMYKYLDQSRDSDKPCRKKALERITSTEETPPTIPAPVRDGEDSDVATRSGTTSRVPMAVTGDAEEDEPQAGKTGSVPKAVQSDEEIGTIPKGVPADE